MFWSKSPLSVVQTVIFPLILLILGGTLVSCGALPDNLLKFGDKPQETVILDASYQPVATAKLEEVTPPLALRQLNKSLDQYQPQVRILSPQPNQLLSDTTVQVSLEVQDYPLFKDETLAMGPHLHLIVDNEPYQAVYDVSEPINIEKLSPGSHTLRVFASRPWHESFKNEGAYAETTFHILTQTEDNTPDPNLPLLTYSRPKGNYGAEPILLDFYLTNAPLHIYSPEEGDMNPTADWRIRVTINGESFLLDRWQPIYLKGFKSGENWLKLEFLDGDGNPINNAFNNTARLITFNPDGDDTLSQLVRGELPLEMARSIVTQEAPITNLPSEIPVTETEMGGEEVEVEETEVLEEIEEVTDNQIPFETVELEVSESEETGLNSPEEEGTIIEETDAASLSLEEEETEQISPSSAEEIIEIEEETVLTEEIIPENEGVIESDETVNSSSQEEIIPENEESTESVETVTSPSETITSSEENSSDTLESQLSESSKTLENSAELETKELELKLLKYIQELEQKIEQLSPS